MTTHEVFVEMRMFSQHNKVEKDKWEKEKMKMEMESKRKSL